MAGSNNHPQGLLSFVYHVTYDSSVTSAFNSNPNRTMADFGLSQEEMDAVTAAGAPGSPEAAKLQAVLDLILPQLESTYHQTW